MSTIATYTLKLAHYSLNQYRKHHYVLHKTKKTYSEDIYWQLIAQKIKPVDTPCAIQFIHHRKRSSFDLDNCCILHKFIIDVLCEPSDKNVYGLGIIPDDNAKHIVKLCSSYGDRKDDTIDMVIHTV